MSASHSATSNPVINAAARITTGILVLLANIVSHLLLCLGSLRYAVPLSARPAYSKASGRRPNGSSHRFFMANLLSWITPSTAHPPHPKSLSRASEFELLLVRRASLPLR